MANLLEGNGIDEDLIVDQVENELRVRAKRFDIFFKHVLTS